MTAPESTPDAPRIALGSVYHPPDEPYPRLLIMRRWPRGVAKGSVDQWEPELGPSNDLLNRYLHEGLSWDDFAEGYRAEVLERRNLLAWAARMAEATGVTLLCSSHSDEQCHRSLLAALIREHLAGALPPEAPST
ncbi:MAG: DUF488 family protein [Dehalococcoidia bacterium]|nr:DUF488 family protein [Dehalococcoidia bacterium]